MPRFFVDKAQIDANYIYILGEDAHHISRSLRMAFGEHITVSDTEQYEYECVLEEFLADRVKARIIDKHISTSELPIKVHLFQALPKGDKLDLIIQKSVECGVYEITPFESERCVAKVKEDAEGRKTERRNKIAYEAAKQCGRGIIPKVNQSISFEKVLKQAASFDCVLFCYEGDGAEPLGKIVKKLRSERKIRELAIIIGSEGGFSESEALRAKENACSCVGLGNRILRAETAAIFALSCIVYEFELH